VAASSLLTAQLLCAGLLVAYVDDAAAGDFPRKANATEGTTPVWANVPETISSEWGEFFFKKGQGLETPVPAPDEIEAWKAVQAANDKAKEAAVYQRNKWYPG